MADFEPEYCMRTPWPMAGVTGGKGLRHPLELQPTPLMFGVLALTSGLTRASTNAAPAVGDCLIMTPALAHEFEFVW